MANAFTLRHKSLTTSLSVAPGLTLTRPVEISIGYYSPAGTKRITQSYVAGSGNRFLYNDPEGDGKLRRLRMDVTLSEPKPGGGVTTFAFTMQADLDPLYDVSISPLTFKLLTDCDFVGNSEIDMWWWQPDQYEDDEQRASFSMSAGESVALGRFAWRRSEVSAADALHLPDFNFSESDPRIQFVPSGFLPLPPNLIPGQTDMVETVIVEGSSEKQCTAAIEYTLIYALRWYSRL